MASTEEHLRELSHADRRLLRQTEAATMVGVHPRTIENLRLRGELPSVKIGRSRRYAISDVEALIERCREGAPNSAQVTPQMPTATPQVAASPTSGDHPDADHTT